MGRGGGGGEEGRGGERRGEGEDGGEDKGEGAGKEKGKGKRERPETLPVSNCRLSPTRTGGSRAGKRGPGARGKGAMGQGDRTEQWGQAKEPGQGSGDRERRQGRAVGTGQGSSRAWLAGAGLRLPAAEQELSAGACCSPLIIWCKPGLQQRACQESQDLIKTLTGSK